MAELGHQDQRNIWSILQPGDGRRNGRKADQRSQSGCLISLPSQDETEVEEQAGPEAVPEAVREAGPETVPEIVPEAVPEVAPEATPETVPEIVPEAVPEAAREAVPIGSFGHPLWPFEGPVPEQSFRRRGQAKTKTDPVCRIRVGSFFVFTSFSVGCRNFRTHCSLGCVRRAMARRQGEQPAFF